MHFTHCTPAAAPQHAQDLQLPIGRPVHGPMIYEGLRIVNTKHFVMMHIADMNPAIQSLLDQIAVNQAAGQAVAAGLSDAQLNWRAAQDSWSIAQCLQHLNVSVTQTLPAFDRAIGEGRAKNRLAPGPFRYGWFSRMMVASMEPP